MTKLLILFLIVLGIISFFSFFIKRVLKRFFGPFNNYENKSQKINDIKKTKVIYDRDDVVVMKGDAPDKTERKP